MYETVAQILKKFLQPSDKVIVGVSGGPDSTALLDVLIHYGAAVIVAHVNHGLRGKASDHDEKFVRNLAKKYGVKCFVKRVKISKISRVEETGRIIRREFFQKLQLQNRAAFIATAHTEDDQLETIFFNFLRGSGPKGLAGMKVSEGGFLKPFLNTSKKEILAYLKQRKLEFCKDATNEETKYRRNFLRKKVLPLLAAINPSFKKTVLRNRGIFSSIDEWLSEEAEKFLENFPRSFSLKKFEILPDALKSAVLQKTYQRGTGNFYQLSGVKLQEILTMLRRNIGRKQIICGKNRGRFRLEKGIVTFSKF